MDWIWKRKRPSVWLIRKNKLVDEEKDGDEFKYPLEMTSKIISTINKGVIGEGYPYYLLRVGCD